MSPARPRGRARLYLALAIAGLLGAGAMVRQHPVKRWRAEAQLRRVAAPRTIVRFAHEHVFAGQLVCGELEYKEAGPGLRPRRFTLDLNDGGAWIEGRADETPKRWLYRNLNRRVWSRCMDPHAVTP
jgi:hypothetical protein